MPIYLSNYNRWTIKDVSSPEMRIFPRDQENQGITQRRTQLYLVQAIPKIDAEIAEKDHLWIEPSVFILTLNCKDENS